MSEVDLLEGGRHSVVAVLMADGDRFGGVRLQLRFDHEERRADSGADTAGDCRGGHQLDERSVAVLVLQPSVVLERGEGSETEAVHYELIP